MNAQLRNHLSAAGLTLIALLAFLILPGCTTLKENLGLENEKAEVYLPAEQLIMKGMDDYNTGTYFRAVDYFTEILDRYPFSPQAQLAELKLADSNYYLEHYIEAALLYQEFEEKHPTNEAIPYVMYQRAMCSYHRIDRIDRDVSGAEESIRVFEELLRAYPDSPYSAEARARIKAANEFMVNHEFFVVQFYLRTEKYSEAETRLKYILAMYPDSKIAPRAQELLDLVQAGTPPAPSGITGWFQDLSLPSWTDFTEWME